MLNSYKWLLVSLAATVLIGATTVTYKQNQVKEANLNNQIQDLKEQSKARSEADKQKLQLREQELQQQVKELNEKLQSKAAEKARLAAIEAAKKPVVSKVAQSIVPTAQAATGDNYGLVTKWANHYGVDPAWMHRVVKCESGYRSNAVNGSYWAGGSTPTGISQFLASTYIANARRIGLPAVDERLNPDRSLQVMAWMFSIGQWTQWECR